MPKEVFMTVRLDETTHEQLKQRAAENDRTMAAEIRQALRAYLETAKGAA